MKTTRIMLLAAVLLGALPVMGSAATSISAGLHFGPSGRTSVDLGFFYDDLSPYGHWIQRPRYGWVWSPRVAVSSWRPYLNGHWVWTDLGWLWVSDEPFGWATYHYGRWYDDADYGWEWIPGDEWAPAWVDWRAGNDYIGWAPLPPWIGFQPGVSLNVNLAGGDFVFVPQQRFLDTRLSAFAVPRWQGAQIFSGTQNFTRFNRVNNQVFNAGIPVNRVQQWTGRSVPRYQVADLGWNQRRQGAQLTQNRLAVFRPQVERARVAPPNARPIARRAVLAGAAAAGVIAAHHAFRTAEAKHQPQGVLRQQGRGQRQVQAHQQQMARQQLRSQRQQLKQSQQRAHVQQQQARVERQMQSRRQQQARQQLRSQRQQLKQSQQRAHVQQQQGRAQAQQRFERQAQVQQQQRARQEQRFQRQAQVQQQQQARQQQRFQRQAQVQQQQQARQQERFQRQAQAQQARPQRQFQQAQAQQHARPQGRPPQQGNQGQGGNHHKQRPPERPPQ